MRRVLVTGGGSGIGRDVAQQFAKAGDAVTISGRRMDALQETARGTSIRCVQADVLDEADVAALFDAPYDVVVANAGAGQPSKVVDMTLEHWNRTLAVNLTGTFLTFREALKGMKSGGRLISIASTAGLQGGSNIAAYSAAKHGVLGLVKSLAVEVARSGITCNAVCPGFVDTPMGQEAVANVEKRMGVSNAEALKMVVGRNPMRRMIRTDEVTAAVLFLASSEATMVNGHALTVSGGEI